MDTIEKGLSITHNRPRRPWTTPMIVLALLGTFGITAMVANFYLVNPSNTMGKLTQCLKPSTTTNKDEDLVTECGSSREEALAKGCIFDIMYNGWLPPLCHDSDLHNEALLNTTQLASLDAAGPFPWWRDFNHTIPVHQDDLWSLEESYAHTWETYHVAHCLYDWRFLVKSITRHLDGEDVWVPERIVNASHIHHCNIVVASQVLRQRGRVQVRFGQGRCVRLRNSFLGHIR